MRLIDADKFMNVLNICEQVNQQHPLPEEKLNDKAVNNYETGQKETFELVMEQLEKQPNACGSNDVLMDESKVFDACALVEETAQLSISELFSDLKLARIQKKVQEAKKLLNEALNNSRK